MSGAEEIPGLATRVYRTVTPWYEGRDDAEMNTIGWALFLGVVLLLVPLLPFLILVWLVTKGLDVLLPRDGRGQ